MSIEILVLSASLVAASARPPMGDAISVRNLALACRGDVVLAEPYLGVLVDEVAAGGVDRNGDGDAEDLVLHVVDLRSGAIAATPLATLVPRLLHEGDSFVVRVLESAAGGLDLNGDGDALDAVPVAYDARTGAIRSTALAASNEYSVLAGGRLFYTVREADQGDSDLNGDGDTEDDVVACMDLASGVTVTLPLATIRALVPFGEHLAVLVRERDQGGTSLNGDADDADDVLHVVDLATGAVTNLGQAAFSPVDVGGGLLAYAASEFGDGVDYDGDGQVGFDGILHVHDARAKTTRNVGRAAAFYARSPQVDGLLFYADASPQFPPYDVYALDAARIVLYPLGIDTRALLVPWQTLVAAPSQQSEPAQVADLLTGETSTLSQRFYFARFEGGLLTGYQGNPTGTLRAFEPFPPRERELGPQTGTGLQRYDRAGAAVSWIQNELFASTDFNGDGDMIDAVMRVYDPGADRVHSIDVAVRGFNPREHALSADRLAFLVDEEGEGGSDLNGDGDAEDAVLHLATLDFPTPIERRYGSGVPGWREREPVVEVLGVAAPPRALVLQVRDARPGAPGCLLVGLAPTSIPAFAGELLVAPPFCATADFRAAAIGRTGLARVALDALRPELAGMPLFLQAGVVDPAAQGGVALSAGLGLRIGG